MDVLNAIVFCCVASSLLIPRGWCDNTIKASVLQWSCLCSSDALNVSNFTMSSNCTASCNCIPGPKADSLELTCTCSSLTSWSARQRENCFTSCNCTSGSVNSSISAKKHYSNKIVLAILLLCVVLTTIAFLVSVACYFYRKERILTRSLVISSERITSWNSEANLLSHPSTAIQDFYVKAADANPIAEFIGRIFCLCKRNHQCFSSIITRFSYLDLEHATGKFSDGNLVGLGGSSSVYRGLLKDSRVVAIKRLNSIKISDADSTFCSEIELISRLHHIHVVPFLGYCCEIRGRLLERLLVFEYMPNGNLRDCLDAAKQGQKTLDWGTRINIALGAAKGLEYLHEAAAPRILHRDIKSTNILLDDKYKPKITDLGMAKWMVTDDPANYTSSPARMMGTFGYFAPECAIVGRASTKSDVFSFGVVLLELITGRRPIHKSSNKADESLVIWALPRLSDPTLVISELPDPSLRRDFSEEEMHIMARLAKECLQWDPDSRPTMSEVVQILSTISPDKPKWRNLSIGLFLNSSHSLKNSCEMVRREEISECSSGRMELRQWNLRGIQENQPDNSNKTQTYRGLDRPNAFGSDASNWEFTDAEMVADNKNMTNTSASNTPSWRTCDEELVDLVEPRFETFFQQSFNVV